MAQASDLPVELYQHILSFLPPNHEQQVQWRRRAAEIGRAPRPEGWYLRDCRCTECGRITLIMGDRTTDQPWVLVWWQNLAFRYWEQVRFYTMCPCGKILATYHGNVWWM